MLETLALIITLVAVAAVVFAGLFVKLWRQAQTAAEQQREQNSALQTQHTESEKQLAVLQSQLDSAQKTQAAAEEKTHALQQQLNEKTARAAALEKALENEKTNAADKLQTLQKAEDGMQARFKNLAQTILDEKSKTFDAAAQEKLAPLLAPLRQNLDSFRKRIDDLHGESTKERASLKSYIEQLEKRASEISAETDNLAKALKGSGKVQGDWGEEQLKMLLENSGLKEEVHYRLQKTFETAEGAKQRPDATIFLPDNKQLIIDAKVSLTAFVRYTAAEDDAERAVALKTHIASVRTHVDSLHKAAYNELPAVNSPDFVLMFMPVEPAYILALQEDNTLFSYAYKKQVVLISPTTLLPVLRTAANLWLMEKQRLSTQDVINRGRLLYEKFAGFTDNIKEIGNSLAGAQEAYKKARSKLSEGSGNLIRQAEQLKEMGVTSKKELAHLPDLSND